MKTFQRYSLHMASLTAAGLSLSSKSDAAVIAVGGSGQEDPNGLTFSGFSFSGGFSLSVSSDIFNICGNLSFQNEISSGNNELLVFAFREGREQSGFDIFDQAGQSIFDEGSVPGVDLSDSGNNWSSSSFASVTAGDRFVVGWRYRADSFQEYNYGWTTVEIGSVIHGESMANDVQGEGIVLGTSTVPEPGSLALLALGGAGLVAQRKRRRTAA